MKCKTSLCSTEPQNEENPDEWQDQSFIWNEHESLDEVKMRRWFDLDLSKSGVSVHWWQSFIF